MLRRNFRKSSGVILDVCGEHGSWLDADELEQITGFILSGGAPSPVLADPPERPRNEARALAEFARIRARHERPTEVGTQQLAGGLLKLIKLLLD
jgi:hypothetical protein